MRFAFVIALLGVSLFAGAAEAKRGGGIVSYGDEIFDLGPVDPSKPERRIGRLCQHVALFWADIATWDCRIVVANADLTRYGEVPAEGKFIVETAYANAPSNRGWWNQYGAYVFLAFIVLGLIGKLRKSGAAHADEGSAPRVEPDVQQPQTPSLNAPRPEVSPVRAGFGRRGVA